MVRLPPPGRVRRSRVDQFKELTGAMVVLPELDGLATFDRSHLNEASAERWSAAVLGKIGPVLDRCIGRAAD